MTWVKIDDTLPGNQKVLSVPVATRWCYLSSICYASLNKTDGFIPRTALKLVSGSPSIAAALVDAGLWESVDGGWTIHDYLEHNRSKDKIERVTEGARKAGIARQNGSETLAKRSADQAANGSAFSQRNALSASASGSVSPLVANFQDHRREQIERNASETLPENRFKERYLTLETYCHLATPADYDSAQTVAETHELEAINQAISEVRKRKRGARIFISEVWRELEPEERNGTANQRRRPGPVVVSNGSDWEAADRARDLLPRRSG